MFSKLKEKISALPDRFWDDFFLVVAIFLIALASFGIGRLSVIYGQNEPLRVVYPEENALEQGAAAVSAIGQTSANGQYVASINGTKYYLPNCSGVRRIKEENKIWFSSQEEAKISGFTPAANCPGI